jgi:hypothetical protein
VCVTANVRRSVVQYSEGTVVGWCCNSMAYMAVIPDVDFLSNKVKTELPQ